MPVTRDGLSALAEVVESIRPIRPDRRAFPILPARMAMVHRDDARAGRLFAPAARPNPQRGGSEVLPGFGPLRSEVMRTPALPLTLYDLGGGRSMTRGRGRSLGAADLRGDGAVRSVGSAGPGGRVPARSGAAP